MTFNCTRYTALPCMCPGCQTMTAPTTGALAAAERLSWLAKPGSANNDWENASLQCIIDMSILSRYALSLLAARNEPCPLCGGEGTVEYQYAKGEILP